MTLVVIPVFMRERPDLEVTLTTVGSVRAAEPSIEILLVDDHSPARELVDELAEHTARLKFDLLCQPANVGFSRSVNVGLRRALAEGHDAVLLNADMEVLTPDFSSAMSAVRDGEGRLAWVVGAKLIYPDVGLLQHAGIFFSFLTRVFDHRFRYAPESLPEANVQTRCPVTGAFQWIAHECLEAVGLYDEDFQMGFEDVDYCLRVFAAGRDCVYCPEVSAIHHESLFRGRGDDEKLEDWQLQSEALLMKKHRSTGMGEWMIEIV